MADDNSPMDSNDRFCIIRRDVNGVGEPGSVQGPQARPGLFTPADSIANIANDANGTAIAAAVNGILAALRTNGIVTPPT